MPSPFQYYGLCTSLCSKLDRLSCISNGTLCSWRLALSPSLLHLLCTTSPGLSLPKITWPFGWSNGSSSGSCLLQEWSSWQANAQHGGVWQVNWASVHLSMTCLIRLSLIGTALTVHYESQCIPTMLAWSLHQLPVWFQKLSVVATFVIEIGLPFLFFAPFRRLRLFACYGQVCSLGK